MEKLFVVKMVVLPGRIHFDDKSCWDLVAAFPAKLPPFAEIFSSHFQQPIFYSLTQFEFFLLLLFQSLGLVHTSCSKCQNVRKNVERERGAISERKFIKILEKTNISVNCLNKFKAAFLLFSWMHIDARTVKQGRDHL